MRRLRDLKQTHADLNIAVLRFQEAVQTHNIDLACIDAAYTAAGKLIAAIGPNDRQELQDLAKDLSHLIGNRT